MSGVALLLSSICLNATFCPNPQANLGVNSFETLPRDTQKTSEVISDELKKIAAELKGKTLSITTLEDYPLSYLEKDEVTKEVIGKGEIADMKINF
jgi:hypothetical protein